MESSIDQDKLKRSRHRYSELGNLERRFFKELRAARWAQDTEKAERLTCQINEVREKKKKTFYYKIKNCSDINHHKVQGSNLLTHHFFQSVGHLLILLSDSVLFYRRRFIHECLFDHFNFLCAVNCNRRNSK